MSRNCVKVSILFKKEGNRLSLIYTALIIIDMLQFFYVHQIYPSLFGTTSQNSSSSPQNPNDIQQHIQDSSNVKYCISQNGNLDMKGSDFPGTCLRIVNINGFLVLYILFILDGAFNMFSIAILQCNRGTKIIQFFNRNYQKTTYNTIENVLQFIIMYYGDDKLMISSSLLLFAKNLLSIQSTLNYGRGIQFLVVLSGIVVNVILREWSYFIIIIMVLGVIQIFAIIIQLFTHYEFIDVHNHESQDIVSGRAHHDHDEESQVQEIIQQQTKKSINNHKQRSFSSKKRRDQLDLQNNSFTLNLKDQFVEESVAWDKTQQKNEFNNQLHSQNNKKKAAKGSIQYSASMKHNLERKSSLDNMIVPIHSNSKQNQRQTIGDHTNNYKQFAQNNHQMNSFSSIYDRNSQQRRTQFMRYKTTSPGLKNDGTFSIDQSKSKNCYAVSSAGLIPSAGTYTIHSGVSLPKSRQKIGKKPALNLSDIKGLKFSEKFKALKCKSSKKIRSKGGGSLGSRIKVDLEEMGSQLGKRNYISNQIIPQKQRLSPCDLDQPESMLSPANSNHIQEDFKNQYSTKNFQNSSSKLLYGQNEYNNYDNRNPFSCSQSILTERPNLQMNTTVKGRLEEDMLQYQLEKKQFSIGSQHDFSVEKERVNLTDFYGMFFQILSEGIVLFNFESGDININNTLKRLLNTHSEKECIEILFNLKNASLQPLNQTNNQFDNMRSTVHGTAQEEGGVGGGVGNSNNNQEVNQVYSSFMNINSYMYDNSLFTASKNRTGEDQNTSSNQKQPTQKSQKSINIHSNYTYNNQITNSNNFNDDILSQIKRRHSTSSYSKTNTLMSKKTTRFLYKKDEEEEDDEDENSSAEVENSPLYQHQKIKINSGIMSSNIVGFQFQMDAQNGNSLIYDKNNIVVGELPLRSTVKMSQKTSQPMQKQPDSGLYIEESLNQEQGIGSHMFERQQLQQQLQQIISQVDQINESGLKEQSDIKHKKREQFLDEITKREQLEKGSKQGTGATASPKQPNQTNTNKQSHQKPFQKIVFSIAKEFTVKDQFEKIEEEMQDYTNESRYEMLGHHIKMLCKLDQFNQSRPQDDTKTAGGTTTPTNNLPNNLNQQTNYYNSSMSYNAVSGLNLFQHQNSLYIDGYKNRKTSRFSNLSALNAFQQQNTVQFIQQQLHNQHHQQQNQQQQQQTQQSGSKNNEKKVIEITFIPCFVNKQKCLVLIVKDVSHFNSIKVLKDMNENRSKMLNYVVHEIRSPLNSIMNYLNSSLEYLSKDLFEAHIDPALQSAQMLNVLIQDLLDMAQMKAGKYKLNIRPFRIENLIEDVKRTMKVIVKQKSSEITLDSYIDPQITTDISSDQLRIKQILINLISNNPINNFLF